MQPENRTPLRQDDISASRTAYDTGSEAADPAELAGRGVLGDPNDLTPPGASDPLQQQPGTRPKRMSNVSKALVAIVVLLALLAVGGLIAVRVTMNNVLGDVQRIPNVFAPLDQSTRPQKAAGTEQTLNFLLAGVDTRADQQTTGSASTGDVFVPGRQRSDVIMLVHMAADRRNCWVVSIPRDSWVGIPGYGKNKINAAYSIGGGSLLVETVEQLTKLRIDHFAAVDFAGFKDITDAVGGVDVRVAATTHDNRGSFQAGVNHLDGDQALAYVRQRDNLPNGDLDRVRRQQNIIKALMAKFGSQGILSNPARTLGLADAVAKAVSVDNSLTNADLRFLAMSLRHLMPKGVRFLTAPVSRSGRQGTQSVVYLNTTNSAELWAAIRHDDVAAYAKLHPADSLGLNPR
jgi:LCP family protein required for cell wall assembly